MNTNLADFYGRQYSTMMEYGFADPKDANDLTARLESVRESWENLCPGFHKWFVSKREAIFQNSVIECARKNTNVHGLFYNNSIECQHYLEKKEQSFRKGTVKYVIKTFKSLVQRRQDEEVRAIYRSNPYRLSDRYKKFFFYNVYTKLNTNAKKTYKHTTVPRRQYAVSLGKIKM